METAKPPAFAQDLAIHVMRTLEWGTPEDQETPVTEPGNNDPTYRGSAFAYGVSLAMRPIIDNYKSQAPQDIQEIFKRTYRLSFHYSAGSPFLQSLFQLRTSQLLRDTCGEDVLHNAANHVVFDSRSAGIPGNHMAGRGMQRHQQRAPAIWQFYMNIAKNSEDVAAVPPLDRMGSGPIDDLRVFGGRGFIALSIPYFMINSEINYVREGRPNKPDFAKRYRSDIREHAIENKPTGNPEFDIIFSEMGIVLGALRKLSADELHDFYLMTTLKTRLTNLEAAWTERHKKAFKSTE